MTYVGRDARSEPGMTDEGARHDGCLSGMIESIGMAAGGRSVWCPKGIAVHGI